MTEDEMVGWHGGLNGFGICKLREIGSSAVISNRTSGNKLAEFKSYLLHLLAWRLWSTYLTSPCLNCLICCIRVTVIALESCSED